MRMVCLQPVPQTQNHRLTCWQTGEALRQAPVQLGLHDPVLRRGRLGVLQDVGQRAPVLEEPPEGHAAGPAQLDEGELGHGEVLRGPLNDRGLRAGLILPMGYRGPAFLAYDNFDVYLQWNQSATYALTAAHLVTRGLPVKLYEAGATVAAHVRDWGHVRLFSPWGFNTDAAATAILREHGWQAPPATALPTGGDLYSAYLHPLAEAPPLKAVVETGARVRNVTRAGIDKVVSRGRGDHPFALVIDAADGGSRIDLARAVIDASGTWSSPSA